jgi:hypothetical protein
MKEKNTPLYNTTSKHQKGDSFLQKKYFFGTMGGNGKSFLRSLSYDTNIKKMEKKRMFFLGTKLFFFQREKRLICMKNVERLDIAETVQSVEARSQENPLQRAAEETGYLGIMNTLSSESPSDTDLSDPWHQKTFFVFLQQKFGENFQKVLKMVADVGFQENGVLLLKNLWQKKYKPALKDAREKYKNNPTDFRKKILNALFVPSKPLQRSFSLALDRYLIANRTSRLKDAWMQKVFTIVAKELFGWTEKNNWTSNAIGAFWKKCETDIRLVSAMHFSTPSEKSAATEALILIRCRTQMGIEERESMGSMLIHLSLWERHEEDNYDQAFEDALDNGRKVDRRELFLEYSRRKKTDPDAVDLLVFDQSKRASIPHQKAIDFLQALKRPNNTQNAEYNAALDTWIDDFNAPGTEKIAEIQFTILIEYFVRKEHLQKTQRFAARRRKEENEGMAPNFFVRNFGKMWDTALDSNANLAERASSAGTLALLVLTIFGKGPFGGNKGLKKIITISLRATAFAVMLDTSSKTLSGKTLFQHTGLSKLFSGDEDAENYRSDFLPFIHNSAKGRDLLLQLEKKERNIKIHHLLDAHKRIEEAGKNGKDPAPNLLRSLPRNIRRGVSSFRFNYPDMSNTDAVEVFTTLQTGFFEYVAFRSGKGKDVREGMNILKTQHASWTFSETLDYYMATEIISLLSDIARIFGKQYEHLAQYFAQIKVDNKGSFLNYIKNLGAKSWEMIAELIEDGWEVVYKNGGLLFTNVKSGLSGTWDSVKGLVLSASLPMEAFALGVETEKLEKKVKNINFATVFSTLKNIPKLLERITRIYGFADADSLEHFIREKFGNASSGIHSLILAERDKRIISEGGTVIPTSPYIVADIIHAFIDPDTMVHSGQWAADMLQSGIQFSSNITQKTLSSMLKYVSPDVALQVKNFFQSITPGKWNIHNTFESKDAFINLVENNTGLDSGNMAEEPFWRIEHLRQFSEEEIEKFMETSLTHLPLEFIIENIINRYIFDAAERSHFLAAIEAEKDPAMGGAVPVQHVINILFMPPTFPSSPPFSGPSVLPRAPAHCAFPSNNEFAKLFNYLLGGAPFTGADIENDAKWNQIQNRLSIIGRTDVYDSSDAKAEVDTIITDTKKQTVLKAFITKYETDDAGPPKKKVISKHRFYHYLLSLVHQRKTIETMWGTSIEDRLKENGIFPPQHAQHLQDSLEESITDDVKREVIMKDMRKRVRRRMPSFQKEAMRQTLRWQIFSIFWNQPFTFL